MSKESQNFTGVNLTITWGETAPPRIDLPDRDRGFGSEQTGVLAQTALDAVEELMARAYHDWLDQWPTPPPDHLEIEMEREQAAEDRRLKQVFRAGDQSADRVRRSQTERLRQRLMREKRAEAVRAASKLATIGIVAANWLECLSEQRPDLLKEVAAKLAVLPFNLGLSRPRKGGKRGLLRAKVAKAHLTKLNLGVAHHPVAETSQEITGKRSVYRVAAEQLMNLLPNIKAYPGNYISR